MITFRVPDMTCGHCASTIARAIASVDKDARLEVSIPDKLVRVSSRAAQAELAEAIAEAGYTAEAVAAPPTRVAPTAGGCCCSTKAKASEVGPAGPVPPASCCG